MAAALRRALLSGLLAPTRARHALQDYADLPLTRHGHQGLLACVLSLHENFSAYDATYVALAERLDAPLLTADAPLAKAIHTHTGITTLPA